MSQVVVQEATGDRSPSQVPSRDPELLTASCPRISSLNEVAKNTSLPCNTTFSCLVVRVSLLVF